MRCCVLGRCGFRRPYAQNGSPGPLQTRHLNKRTCHPAQSIYYPMIYFFHKGGRSPDAKPDSRKKKTHHLRHQKTALVLTTLRTSGFYGVLCWSAGSACSKAQVRRVPFRKRRSLIRVQRESVNSNRPEFLPTVRYRQSIRHRSRLTIYNRKAPLSAGLLFNSSFVPSPTTFITF